VAVKDGEAGVRGGDEPTVELKVVAGPEDDLLEIEANLGGGIRDVGDGVVNKRRLHKIERHRQNGITDKHHTDDSQGNGSHRSILICPCDMGKLQSAYAEKKENKDSCGRGCKNRFSGADSHTIDDESCDNRR